MKSKTEKISHNSNSYRTSQSDHPVVENLSQKEIPRVSYNPTPLDLDAFLPWICLQWECSRHIIVKRTQQELYVSKKEKSISTKTKMFKSKQGDDKEKSHASDLIDEVDVIKTAESDKYEGTTEITTIYDSKGNLVEIAFYKQNVIPRMLIHVLNFCFTWHTSLTKLTLCYGGLTAEILHDISKLLPNTNITDLILNGNYVPEGNYYILFNNTSLLRHLSMSRCKLNDIACTKLIAKLESGSSIQLLDLSFNALTDDTAMVIGNLLRSNRTLLHLNLTGNKVTTHGARAILNSLAEFPLTVEEIMDMKRKKFTFLENKIAIYNRCLEDARKKPAKEAKRLLTAKPSRHSPLPKTAKTQVEVAEDMTVEITGEFNDPYNVKGTVMKNEHVYCKGNFSLCSLNISYNNLDYLFVKHVHNVLKYQSKCAMPGATGLLRVVFEGNALPVDVPEYILIDQLLRYTVMKNQKTTIK